MGLDIYAGTLTRYYSGNWKTSVQQWAEKNGMQVNIIRPEDQNVDPAPVEEIFAVVTEWRDQLVQALADSLTEQPYWNEDNDITPYYTDKPDWDAVHALMLYIICKLQGIAVPRTVAKDFDLYNQPIYKEFITNKNNAISLFDGDGWWIPISDAFMFNGYLPTGDQRTFATVGMIKYELEQINTLEWNADEQTIISWVDTEGYPADVSYSNGEFNNIAKNEEYNTESLAKFAFSILWQAVEHSLKYGTLIIYDY